MDSGLLHSLDNPGTRVLCASDDDDDDRLHPCYPAKLLILTPGLCSIQQAKLEISDK